MDPRSASRMDLGEQRSLGLDALSLWKLAAVADAGLGLGAGRSYGAAALGARARELGARWQSSGVGGEESTRSQRRAGKSFDGSGHAAHTVAAKWKRRHRNCNGQGTAKRDHAKGTAARI